MKSNIHNLVANQMKEDSWDNYWDIREYAKSWADHYVFGEAMKMRSRLIAKESRFKRFLRRIFD